MFLDLTLGLLYLRCTGGPRRFPDEFATSGDTVEQVGFVSIVEGNREALSAWKSLPSSVITHACAEY